MGLLKTLFNLFNTNPIEAERKRIEDYLAKSVDLVDLERRQRELSFGKKGWL